MPQTEAHTFSTPPAQSGPFAERYPLGLRPQSSFAGDPSFVAALKSLERETLPSVVNGAINDKGWDREVAEIARLEFLRHFSLRHLTAGKIKPSPLADDFWHV